MARPEEARRYGGDDAWPVYHEANQEWDITRRVVLACGNRQEKVDYGPCRLRYLEPIWESEVERFTYMNAVEGHPRRDDEGPLAYVARISALVTARFRGEAAKKMPSVRMGRRQTDERLAKLRGQM
jgi:hypothetical protein